VPFSAEGDNDFAPESAEAYGETALPMPDAEAEEPINLDPLWATPPQARTLELARKFVVMQKQVLRFHTVERLDAESPDILIPEPARSLLDRMKHAALAVVSARLEEARLLRGDKGLPTRGLNDFFLLPFEQAEAAGVSKKNAEGKLEGELWKSFFSSFF